IWFVRLSTGTSFGTETTWASDAGDRSDLFLVGDVNGDGRADLIAVGRGSSTTTTVYTSTGSRFTFAAADTVSGFSPDYVLIGDVTGDRRADFVAGSVLGDTTVQWNVRSSTGCVGTLCFGSFQRWSNDAGDDG